MDNQVTDDSKMSNHLSLSSKEKDNPNVMKVEYFFESMNKLLIENSMKTEIDFRNFLLTLILMKCIFLAILLIIIIKNW
jgi:hypothetical protein